MRQTRNAMRAGLGGEYRQATPLTPNRSWAAQEFGHGRPRTLRALAKAFMKYRAAKLAADPSVDTFFNRGESATRFAYFDE